MVQGGKRGKRHRGGGLGKLLHDGANVVDDEIKCSFFRGLESTTRLERGKMIAIMPTERGCGCVAS